MRYTMQSENSFLIFVFEIRGGNFKDRKVHLHLTFINCIVDLMNLNKLR